MYLAIRKIKLISDLSIVVPTFNEVNNVKPLIDALHKVLDEHKWEVLFVDDDSNDGTAAHVREISQVDPRVRCVQRLGRRGLSSACIEGVLASSAPYILIMDADMQHDEVIIPDMLAQLKEQDFDIAIGSRYTEGGSTGVLSSSRVKISRAATRISQTIFKNKVNDPMSGFFMVRRSFFESVMHKLSGKGFKILLDILVSCDSNLKFVEVPYVMRQRTHGESKLSSKVIWEFFSLIIDKLLGRILPLRFLSFAAVGLSGVLVHLVVLWLLHKLWMTSFIPAQAVATIVAMTTNYILNNELTYRDKKLRGINFIKGLFTFYAACSLGAFFNLAIAGWFFDQDFPWWLAGLSGAIAGAVWNYAVTSVFTWGILNRKKQ